MLGMQEAQGACRNNMASTEKRASREIITIIKQWHATLKQAEKGKK